MSPPDAYDGDHAISYKVLERGTPVVDCDGDEIGSVREVLENEAEHIFDGLVLDTPAGARFVDAPEVARITPPKGRADAGRRRGSRAAREGSRGGPALSRERPRRQAQPLPRRRLETRMILA